MGRVLDHIETWIVGILGLAMLAVAIAQVLARYVLPWLVAGGGEEIVVYLFVWAAMIACAGAAARTAHIRADLLLRALSPRQLRIVELINAIAAAGFCALLVWYGWEVVDIALLIDERSQTGISFPMWIYYLALPAGALLMLIAYVGVIHRILTGRAAAAPRAVTIEDGI
ncbi:TRAP-type C4-dicarboxylate transport system permease small subunit [Stella humosa]|uniref:TRAP transporter small permease protein n=2 Tax=Stella humosa TaxID=94 RepID=A0A3N1L0V4_9PROT|nr:TRAP transporter small permease subunit [Stella humosa]ROP83145.1 TRAP-type C4-dicarboxylate transport system permease small subunit [Stella humosa]BBK30078.1 TRAP transporter small permease protein [Stella humosa]